MASRSKNEPTHRKVRARGRPLKLTPELQATLCRFLQHGAYVETAAAAAGIDKVTFYAWMKLGAEKPGTVYADFSNAIAKAMAEAELADLTVLSIAAKKGNWSAAAWRLERRNPKRWGSTKRIAVPDEDDDDRSSFRLNYSLDDDDDKGSG